MKYFLLFLLVFCVAVPITSAHVLETDGTIGAVLHMDPNDAPVANEPTSFYFDITDTTKQFSLTTCDCSVRILENKKELYSAVVGAASLTAASATYTFSQANVYTVQLLGTPRIVGAFQLFTINYTVRVTGGAVSGTSSMSSNILIIAVLLVGAIALYFAFRRPKATSSNTKMAPMVDQNSTSGQEKKDNPT